MMPEQILGTSSTTIDQHRYEMQMLPGTRSWKLMLRITKMLGPGLGKILDTVLSTVRKGKLAGAKLTGVDVMQALMGMELSESFISEVVELMSSGGEAGAGPPLPRSRDRGGPVAQTTRQVREHSRARRPERVGALQGGRRLRLDPGGRPAHCLSDGGPRQAGR